MPGQTLSRIHHDSRQQPEVVSAVPDLVHLPRGDGGPLLVLPESVQLCVEDAKTKEGAGKSGRKIKTRLVKVLSLTKKKWGKKPGCRCFPQNKDLLAVCRQDGDQSGSCCTRSSEWQRWNFSFFSHISVVSSLVFRLRGDLFGGKKKTHSFFLPSFLLCLLGDSQVFLLKLGGRKQRFSCNWNKKMLLRNNFVFCCYF